MIGITVDPPTPSLLVRRGPLFSLRASFSSSSRGFLSSSSAQSVATFSTLPSEVRSHRWLVSFEGPAAGRGGARSAVRMVICWRCQVPPSQVRVSMGRCPSALGITRAGLVASNRIHFARQSPCPRPYAPPCTQSRRSSCHGLPCGNSIVPQLTGACRWGCYCCIRGHDNVATSNEGRSVVNLTCLSLPPLTLSLSDDLVLGFCIRKRQRGSLP